MGPRELSCFLRVYGVNDSYLCGGKVRSTMYGEMQLKSYGEGIDCSFKNSH